MRGPRELTKHFGTDSGGSHSLGECRVSVVGSGCSKSQTRVCRKCSSFSISSHPPGCTRVLVWREPQCTYGVAVAGGLQGCVCIRHMVAVQIWGCAHKFAWGVVYTFVCSWAFVCARTKGCAARLGVLALG